MILRIKTGVKDGGECSECCSLGFLREIRIWMYALLKIFFLMGKLCWSLGEEGMKQEAKGEMGWQGDPPQLSKGTQPQACSYSAS